MELLSPAGNFNKLKAAITFGADAVYMGGPAFGLRAFAGNFSFDEMEHALKYLHERGKKGYVTMNVYPSTEQLDEVEPYIKRCADLKADGIIISDPGIFSIAKQSGVNIPISLSTQANTTNLSSVNFWGSLGAERVILAREVKKHDMQQIVKGANCEIETFIHGAICISMSGRCLISAYMTGRDANQGECTHPCRWKYSLMEETREGEFYPVYEDEDMTYLYNSKDMCLLHRIGELVGMGVKSGKIEGRMKSVMYASIVTGVYRQAIDKAMKDPENYTVDPHLEHMLSCVSNRGYTEGFYSEEDDYFAINRDNANSTNQADFLAVAENTKDGKVVVSCRAKFVTGEKLAFVTPSLEKIEIAPSQIIAEDSEQLVDNTRPNYKYLIPIEKSLPEGSLLLRFK